MLSQRAWLISLQFLLRNYIWNFLETISSPNIHFWLGFSLISGSIITVDQLSNIVLKQILVNVISIIYGFFIILYWKWKCWKESIYFQTKIDKLMYYVMSYVSRLVLLVEVPILITYSKVLNSWHTYWENINKHFLPKYFKWLVINNFYKRHCNHINLNSIIPLWCGYKWFNRSSLLFYFN